MLKEKANIPNGESHLISGVERLRAVATRVSSQARLAGSARPSSALRPALPLLTEEGSTWAGRFEVCKISTQDITDLKHPDHERTGGSNDVTTGVLGHPAQHGGEVARKTKPGAEDTMFSPPIL